MKLTFRQGIARHQSDINGNPTFLQRNGNYVDLIVSPDPTVLVYAHKNATYVVEEIRTVQNAWGPFSGPGTKYLYWDVNLLNGQLTRGFTLLPILYTSAAPVTPAVDQHWFDTIHNIMHVWNGKKWQEKIRVFAGEVTSNSVIHPAKIGSQAGLTTACEGGQILLDSFGMPLRQSDGTFLTSATWLNVVNFGTVTTRLDQSIMHGMAAEEIPQFSCVMIRQGRRFVLARSTDHNTRVGGVVVEDMYEGDTGVVVSSGVLRSPSWSFPPATMNRPLFCGPTGEVTLTPPTQGVCQQIGFVYDSDAMYVNLHQVTVLDDPNDTIAPPPPPPVSAPISNFTFGTSALSQGTTAISGMAPLDVYFVNTSVGATQVEWDFVNDGYVDSVTPNPMFTYTTPGTYTVRQVASNTYGSDEEVKPNVITVLNPNLAGEVNLGISFGAPAQIIGGNTFSVQVITTNDGLVTATNVQRVIRLRTDNSTQVAIVAMPPGCSVTTTGPVTQVTLPVGNIASGGAMTSVLQLSVSATANAFQIEGTAMSLESDPTLADNSASLTVPVKP